MNIPVEVVCVFLTGILGLQGWTLTTVISLKTKMAVLETRLRDALGEPVEIKSYGHKHTDSDPGTRSAGNAHAR